MTVGNVHGLGWVGGEIEQAKGGDLLSSLWSQNEGMQHLVCDYNARVVIWTRGEDGLQKAIEQLTESGYLGWVRAIHAILCYGNDVSESLLIRLFLN